MRLRRRHALLALVCWVPFAGCTCSGRPGSVDENTPQGQALLRMKNENVQIVPKLEGKELPIAFSPIVIEETEHKGLPVIGKDSRRYRALLPWKLTVPLEELRKKLHEQARKERPDTSAGSATVLLEIAYADETGTTKIGKETMRISLQQTGTQVLAELGKSTIPATATVRALSFDWSETPTVLAFKKPRSAVTAVEGKSPSALTAPEGFPFALDLLHGEEGAPDSKLKGKTTAGPAGRPEVPGPVVPGSKLKWKPIADDSALRRALTEDGATVPSRPATSVAVVLTGLDKEGRQTGKQTVELPIGAFPPEGTPALFQATSVDLGALAVPFSVKVELQSMTWAGRTFNVKY